MRRCDVAGVLFATLVTSSWARAQECVNQRPTDPGARYAFGEEPAAAFDSESGSFRVWYAEAGEHAVADVVTGEVPASVRRAAAILDEASQYFHSVLGYEIARSDADYPSCSSNGGDGRLDVYLVNFNAADGSIGIDHCSAETPATCAGFMLVDHRFDAYPDFETGARTVLPHEYFHLIQAAYANPVATWWSEGTAQWATKGVYPDLDDMERYFGIYLDNVDRPIDLPPASAAQPFSYATALFVVFLSERFDVEIVRDVFLAMNAEGLSELEALDVVLAERGTNLGEAFAEFARWNVATGSRAGEGGYLDGALYPELPLPGTAADFDAGIAGALAGLSANYHVVSSDFDDDLDVEVDAERTRVDFVPVSEGVAQLDDAVELPGRVQGPGVLVIASLSSDHRDATYSVVRGSADEPESEPTVEPSEDAGASGDYEEPMKLRDEAGCSLALGARPSGWAWGLVLALGLVRRRLRNRVVAAGACSLLGCTAAPPEDTAIRSQAIVDGEPDTEHTAVFRLLTRKDGRNGLCTGILIAPDLLLTARHCVADTPEDPVRCGEFPFGENLEPSELLASNALRPNLDSAWSTTREVRVPEAIADLCGSDIALLRFEDPVDPEMATPYAPDLDGAATATTTYTALGYGNVGDEPGVDYGERRRREGLRIQCGTGECPGPVMDTEFAGEAGICNGDSGGPALAPGNVVLGVASRGSEGCATPVYAAVAPFADWLRSEARRAAEDADYDLPEWVDPGAARDEDAGRPEPEEEKPPVLASEGCSVSAPSRDRPLGAFGWFVVSFLAVVRRSPTQRTVRPASSIDW